MISLLLFMCETRSQSLMFSSTYVPVFHCVCIWSRREAM